MSWVFEMFSHPFMVRALVAGVAISLVAALVGALVVLRKKSMIGDGLSHVAFLAFALATVMGVAPLWLAIPVVTLVSFVVLSFGKNKKIDGDAMIALMSASALAIGTMAISVSKGVNIDLNSYLFGSILAINFSDMILSVVLSFVAVALFVVMYHRIFAIAFDEDFAKAIGVKTRLIDAGFAIICSVVIVLGMRLLGALLISSLIIFPVLISMQIFGSFKKVVVAAAVISVANFVIGLVLSYSMATPTGATVVIVNLVGLIIARILNFIKK